MAFLSKTGQNAFWRRYCYYLFAIEADKLIVINAGC